MLLRSSSEASLKPLRRSVHESRRAKVLFGPAREGVHLSAPPVPEVIESPNVTREKARKDIVTNRRGHKLDFSGTSSTFSIENLRRNLIILPFKSLSLNSTRRKKKIAYGTRRRRMKELDRDATDRSRDDCNGTRLSKTGGSPYGCRKFVLETDGGGSLLSSSIFLAFK